MGMILPGGIVGALRDVATSVRNRTKSTAALMSKTRISVRQYHGTLGGDSAGAPIRLRFIGNESSAPEVEAYFKPPAGEKSPPREPPEVIFRGNLLQYAMRRTDLENDANADVVVHEAFPGAPTRDADFLHYPMLEGSLRVAPTIEQQIRRVRSRAQRRLMREVLRADAYETHTVTSREALESFRTTMYEPYVRGRFGAWGHIDAPDELRTIYDRCGSILRITARGGDEPIAGALLLDERRFGGALAYHRNGFVGGWTWPPSLMAERTAALELALMKHAIANRFARIDLGYARAFLNDGLVLHKRRLGCTFNVAPYSPLYRVRVRSGLRAAVFARYPLVVGGPGAFTAVLGFDGLAPQISKRAWRGILKGYAVSISATVASAPAGLRSALIWTRGGGAGEAAFREAVAETLDFPEGVEFRADVER